MSSKVFFALTVFMGLACSPALFAQVNPPPMILGSQARIDVEADILMKMFSKDYTEKSDDDALSFVVDFFARNPQLDVNLFMPDSKKTKELVEILDEFKETRDELNSNKEMSSSTVLAEKYKLTIETNEKILQLIDSQELANLRKLFVKNSCLPKLLTRTPVGEVLGLTLEQEQRIEESAKQISRDLDNEVAKWKQKAVADIEQHLTDDQREKLAKLFANNALQSITNDTNVETLAFEYSFRKKTMPGVDDSRLISMDEPDEARQKLKEIIRKKHQEMIERGEK